MPSCPSCGSLLLFKVESEHHEDAWGCMRGGRLTEAWNLSIRLDHGRPRQRPQGCLDGDAVTAEDAVNFAIFAIRDALHVNGVDGRTP